MTKNNNKEFNSFASFYPYYLAEHKNKTCRRLHFIGSTLVLLVLLFALVFAYWSLLWLLPIAGYGFAWVGHFFFEKNKPATFQYPLYSLMGDWVMYKDIIRGKVPW
ncbi:MULTISPECIES: DUF962 domain-containing protein [Pseudoalteromonas]|jgi:hypothetical protein|uniref:DUF962 domain-containing protein n=1 Tax=Pseudoalteromonas TaxID=53246 RepID=UPI000BAE5077|nr:MULTISPECIES: DUF962 domain-containing protein [Pseudoalteromonas]AUJ69603.1 hypothetical protein PNC201_06460 [Pseudoalteromonas sp. NC201]MBR8842775.1 DUF962 domain-containing protein [Pseudoalteromonas sp. JC3]MCG7553298.1 DUF962 domain-containing protein [Pseudoalteromonas sp. Of11M-6]PAY01852.1 hypothetical protein CKO50_07900 [Pseudoalteromonas sp. HM-SA03]RZG04780.1 DUF962 domain-containing protein [Pseudoalteromonas sp. CO348]